MKTLLDRLFGRARPVVETAGPRDSAAFARLHAASFHRGWSEHEFEQLLVERNVIAHRLKRGRHILGFILSRLAADEAEILSVAVAPNERGQGLSRDLLHAHLGQLAALGIKTLHLEVEEANVPARRLYARSGFRDVGHRDGYYQGAGATRARAVVMSRDLS
jgi:ribosomal-protein-alanine N-acetyltransferase